MPRTLRTGSCSLQGLRSDNEDAVAVDEFSDLVLCQVADGMGGGGLGAQASQLVVATLAAEVDKPARDRNGCTDMGAALRCAIARAHDAVLALHQQGGRAASTVTVALWLRGTEVLHIAHVGDSSAWLVRGQWIERLTRVHDAIQLLADAEGISYEEMQQRVVCGRVLVRILGSAEPAAAEPDLRIVPVHAGDRVLLCTDGLSTVVADQHLLAALPTHRDVQACADALCRLALDHGSRDDVSCVVIEAA
jgi:protein phosphatase